MKAMGYTNSLTRARQKQRQNLSGQQKLQQLSCECYINKIIAICFFSAIFKRQTSSPVSITVNNITCCTRNNVWKLSGINNITFCAQVTNEIVRNKIICDLLYDDDLFKADVFLNNPSVFNNIPLLSPFFNILRVSLWVVITHRNLVTTHRNRDIPEE